MTDASPIASPISTSAAPYGISAIRPLTGVSAADVADDLYFLPDEIATLPQRQVTSDEKSATVVYAIDEGVPVPRFGMIVAVKVDASPDADTLIANLEHDRWGDPKDHVSTGAGAGSETEPAYREFSRVFPPGLFLLPNRPVYFLLWYRANDDFAFMVIGDNPAVREGLVQAVSDALSREARRSVSSG